MAKQRYINDTFWTDSYIETLEIEEKLLFLYFLTNPLCNVAGIYEITESRIVYETKLPLFEVKKIKNKFVKDKKILIFKDWILFINFAKNQSPNPNVLIGMQRIINTLPSEVKALKGFERLSHFTLLNLTLPNSAKAVKLSINKKTMQTINYDTGEVIEEPKKTNKSKEYIRLARMFDKLASDYTGKPIITPKSYFIVANAIKNHKLSIKGIEVLYESWFSDTKIKTEDKVKMSFCLSASNINSFKVKN